MEDLLERTGREQKDFLAGLIQDSANPEHVDHVIDLHIEHQEIFGDIYPRHLRYSFLFLLNSLIEAHLNDYCRYLADCAGIDITLNDLQGQGIERARKYLDKVLGVLSSQDTIWEPILRLNKVRNAAAHCGGDISDSRDKTYLEDLANRGLGIAIDSGDRIVVSEEFCSDCIKGMMQLFSKLTEMK